MIIVQKETTPIADECILLGRQCENEARQVQFDLSWLIGEYGSGTATLVHQRNKDTAPYICTATQTGNTLTWTLDNQDTAYDGWGKAELRWTVGDVLAKTLIYKTMVIRSITADTTIPEPLESWYDQMIDYIDTHGGGGGGTTDYSALSNKPSINDVTLSGNKTAADLGLGTYSKPSGGIPASDIASGVIPVIDATLSNTGEAADAKATGDALALKANKVQLKDVVTGTCSTGASTAKKVVVLDDANANIGSNKTIIVYFSNGNSANTPTIQIGATGSAYPVYYQSNDSGDLSQMNTNALYSHWGAGIHVFRFSSGKWIASYPDMYHIKTLFSYISSKAGTASPTFTGTPNAPTASTGTDTTQIATTAFVQQEISAQSISATVTDGNLTLSMGVVNNG